MRQEPSIKSTMGLHQAQSLCPTTFVDTKQYVDPGRVQIADVYGAIGGGASNQIVEIAGSLPERIAAPVSDRGVQRRLSVPTPEAVVGMIVLQHEYGPPGRGVARCFEGQRWCDRIAVEIVERDAPFEEGWFTLSDIVEPFLVPEDLQRPLPRRHWGEVLVTRGHQERVDGLKVRPADGMALVRREGKSRQPGVRLRGRPGAARPAEARGSRKRRRAGRVPPRSGCRKVGHFVALQPAQRVKEKLAQIRRIEGVRVSAKICVAKLG